MPIPPDTPPRQEPALPALDLPPVQLQADRRIHEYPVEFTGTGSEYFRIWIVNLLLTLVTLGIYYPWAKVRKLQYFYSCTWVDGHAFDFHGDPRKMLKGSLIAGVFFLLYSKTADVGVMVHLAGALLLVALLPLFFRASQRFRMANTSWRGLRLRFTGSVREAYEAMTLPLLWMLIPSPLLLWLFQVNMKKPQSGGATAAEMAARGSAFAQYSTWMAVSSLLLALALPYFLWRFKRYQHGNFGYGQERSEFRATLGNYYGIWLRAVGVVVLFVGLVAFVVFSLMGVKGDDKSGLALKLLLSVGLMVVPAFVLFGVLLKSWLQVRLFNLQWSRTGNAHVRVKSSLAPGAYIWLQVKNYFLIFVTLGLYWPFAVIATKRMALEAMVLRSRIDLDTLAGSAHDGDDEVTGDAAMDFFDFDFGI